MKDFLTTITIDVAVICAVFFGELQKGLNMVLVIITIAYTIAKLFILIKNYLDEKKAN